jgi:hypothetical protein
VDRRILLTISLLVAINPAFAQQCDNILNDKLLDQSSVKNQSAAAEASTFKTCSSSSNNSSTNIGGSYDGIGGTLGDASENARQDCTQGSSSDSQSFFYFAAQKGLKDSVVEAWRQCMASRDNLQCWAAPTTDEREVEFHVSWKNGSTKLPQVTSAPISNGFVFGDDVGRQLLKPGTNVEYGERTFIVSRDDDKRPLRIALNVSLEQHQTFSCAASVPSKTHRVVKRATPQFIAECNSVLDRMGDAAQKPVGTNTSSVPMPPPPGGNAPGAGYQTPPPLSREALACAYETTVDSTENLKTPKGCQKFLSDPALRLQLENAAAKIKALSGLKIEAQNLTKRYGVECPTPAY